MMSSCSFLTELNDMEATAECIPTNLRIKHRVPWETKTVKIICDSIKTASLCNKKNPTYTNAKKLKKAQRELTSANLKEQMELKLDQ